MDYSEKYQLANRLADSISNVCLEGGLFDGDQAQLLYCRLSDLLAELVPEDLQILTRHTYDFNADIARNTANRERMTRERIKHNEKTINDYRITRK